MVTQLLHIGRHDVELFKPPGQLHAAEETPNTKTAREGLTVAPKRREELDR